MTPNSPTEFAAPHIARVALDAPVDRLFDYQAGGAGEGDIGRRVEVPFGRRILVGVLLELTATSEYPEADLKSLHTIDRATPALPPDLIELARFAAGYYRFPLGAVLASLLPPSLRRTERQRREAPPAVYTLTEAGRLALADLPARAPARLALAQRFQIGPLARQDLDERERTLARDWLRQGWLAPAGSAAALPVPPPSLTEEQAAVVAELEAAPAGFIPWLLYGVTGSGKTEVYLRRIGAALTDGLQALVLVPEIHLTPQLEERLHRRFPDRRILSLHSGLAEAERRQDWLAALAGEADIVLGTRLAVFTPMPRLGLIVVDEEHDGAYKQLEGMRYSARDVAVWRGRQRGVPVLLGSATPALETWKNALDRRYRLLKLTRRAHAEAVLPKVRRVDTRGDRPKQGLTATLAAALEDRLQRGEQSLVFINRRGYAPTLLCNACGWVTPCPRCTAHLVLHRAGPEGYRLTCHHCGLSARPPAACPECGSLDLKPSGQGTQRVEETLAERWPQARILRIDRDSTGRKGAFAAMRDQVAAREVDILVGTQLVAKGHDFPHLTLVGVIGADMALSSPDWRASERLFALLMQVAGRAGRAERPGEVLIQTAYPHHPLYQALIHHDYPGFARQTLGERRSAGFPPYSAQVVLRAEGRDADAVMAFLETAREVGEPLERGVILYDPAPALMSRVAHQTRAQLLIQAPARESLRRFLDAWLPRLAALPAKGLRWGVDVDPIES